jgi:phosphocarrier protein
VQVRRKVQIKNPRGLHARPCHALVSAALGYQSSLKVACAGREVEGKSILSLMTLEAPFGSELELVAEGPDAERLVEHLTALVDGGFDEKDA